MKTSTKLVVLGLTFAIFLPKVFNFEEGTTSQRAQRVAEWKASYANQVKEENCVEDKVDAYKHQTGKKVRAELLAEFTKACSSGASAQ